MTKGVILVDFDNVFFGTDLSQTTVQYRLEQFISECLETDLDFESMEIRLYGGWKSNAGYTQKADILRSFMDRFNSQLFPRIFKKRRVLGNVSVVTSLHSLDLEWDDTMQEKHGRHLLKVKMDSSRVCSQDPTKCPVHMIASATRGDAIACPIDGCSQIDVSQLIRMEQKMVDSMMTCDILEYVREPECQIIMVVSDDVDLHPALALAGNKYASQNHVRLVLLVKNLKNSQRFATLLNPYNVFISNWS